MHSIGGFLMALADSVPGVSGGSIAFILGFYDEFIGSLNTLVSKNSKEENNQDMIWGMSGKIARDLLHGLNQVAEHKNKGGEKEPDKIEYEL